MSFLKSLGRRVYGVLPEGRLKRWLTAKAYRSLYPKCVKKYGYDENTCRVDFVNGFVLQSVKPFDPEPIATHLWDYRFPSGGVAMDLGGHYGMVSLYMALSVGPAGKVVVFEADPGNYQILNRNLELNGAKNVIALNKGVYDSNGVLEFYSGGGYTSTFQQTEFVDKNKSKYEVTRVEVVRLDDEWKKLGLKRLDVVKIDIEGSEVMALRGARVVLSNYHPDLMIETHVVDGQLTTSAVLEIIREIGYDKIVVENEKGGDFIFAQKMQGHVQEG